MERRGLRPGSLLKIFTSSRTIEVFGLSVRARTVQTKESLQNWKLSGKHLDWNTIGSDIQVDQ